MTGKGAALGLEHGGLGRLQHGTLAERASAALLTFIRTQQLQPGSMLPGETRLAGLLGVSRPVVREALHGLKGLGVITMKSGKGAVVREVDSSTLEVYFAHALQTTENFVRDVMELRLGVETQSAMLAARRRTPDQRDELRDLVSQMHDNLTRPAIYSSLDRRLHVGIASASGNPMLYHIVHSIQASLEALSLKGMRERRDVASLNEVQSLHEMLVEAIVEGDGPAAAHTMGRHMDVALTVLLAGSTGREGPSRQQ